MKPVITVLITLFFCLSKNAYGRIVIDIGDGRSAYSTSTTYFVQAADLSPQPNLGEKIMTPSGSLIERIDDPKRGLLLKDQNGLLWTSSLMADRPEMPIFDKARFSAEVVSSGYAYTVCAKIGARPPTLTEYKNLAKLFIDQASNFDAKSAARILEPGYPISGCNGNDGSNKCLGESYITNINIIDEYGAFSNSFSLYGNGLPKSGNSGNHFYDGLYQDGSIKCVISPDMETALDTKKQYDALEMPTMKSCDPRLFIGIWEAAETVCSDPNDTTAVLSHPEKILFSISYARYGDDILIRNRAASIKSGELASVDGYRGAAGDEKAYWFNSMMSTDGTGNEFTGHVFKNRKDGKGCDVFMVGISNMGFDTQEYKTLKPQYLFTLGKNKIDGSLVLRANNDGANFCHAHIKNKKIQQALKLRAIQK